MRSTGEESIFWSGGKEDMGKSPLALTHDDVLLMLIWQVWEYRGAAAI